MESEKLLGLSDFEWASTARYICYISSIAGLKKINSNHVASFSLSLLGPEKLLKQKERVLLRLEGNKSSIESFVGRHMSELDELELAVLRSLYLQYRDNVETVRGHIDFIGQCVVEAEVNLLQSNRDGEDDALF